MNRKKGDAAMSEKRLRSNHKAKAISLCLAFILTAMQFIACASADTIPEANMQGWVNFFLICNEGMTNDGGNVGNTLMVVSLSPKTGMIKLMPFTWDTFIR